MTTEPLFEHERLRRPPANPHYPVLVTLQAQVGTDYPAIWLWNGQEWRLLATGSGLGQLLAVEKLLLETFAVLARETLELVERVYEDGAETERLLADRGSVAKWEGSICQREVEEQLRVP